MATIEQRYESSGFVYTKRTRMGFSPKFTITRKVEDKSSTDLVIWAADKHPEPTRADIGEVIAAMAARYIERRIYADTAEGLVMVFEPPRMDATK